MGAESRSGTLISGMPLLLAVSILSVMCYRRFSLAAELYRHAKDNIPGFPPDLDPLRQRALGYYKSLYGDMHFGYILADVIMILLATFFLAMTHRFLAGSEKRTKHLRKSGLGYLEMSTDERDEVRRCAINRMRKFQSVGELPTPFPNGWYGLVPSHQLKRGGVVGVKALGLELVVFRDSTGFAHILDSVCPHLGADLSVGGVVEGNCIACPYHGWKFRGDDGRCTEIPFAEGVTIPDAAKVRSWPSVEVNGYVQLWYDAEGRDPMWFPPAHDGIEEQGWTRRSWSEYYINCLVQEPVENGADLGHLTCVHGPAMFLGGTVLGQKLHRRWFSWFEHVFENVWSAGVTEEDRHIGYIDLLHSVRLGPFQPGFLQTRVRGRQVGPGMTFMDFQTPLGRVVLTHWNLPVEPLLLRIQTHVYCPWYVPTFMAKFLLFGEAVQIERDIDIWNNKKFMMRPLFVKSAPDRLLQTWRRWWAQFTTEHSPRFSFKNDLNGLRTPNTSITLLILSGGANHVISGGDFGQALASLVPITPVVEGVPRVSPQV